MKPTREQMTAALDDAFHAHLVTLFEFAADNTSIAPTDATRPREGLARATAEYQTFSKLIDEASS